MELEYLYVFLGWIAVVLVAYTVYINLTLASLTPIDIIPGETKTDAGAHPRFMIFFAPWCPWSKKAKIHWDSFRKELERYPVTFGGKDVVLEEIDGDVHRDMIRQFKIREYPTFKLVTSSGEVTMDGYPSKNKFRDFLVKNLGAEEPSKLLSRVK
jgi:thiol-disulfide isomerase/thioredoxin